MGLNVALKDLVTAWLSESKHRSLHLLSEETRLSYGTIRNIADGKTVSEGSALKLVLKILPLDRAHQFVAEFLPAFAAHTKTLVSKNFTALPIERVSKTHSSVLLSLAYGAKSLEHLKISFGPRTEKLIEDLEKTGFVEQKDSSVSLVDETHWLNNEIVRDVAHEMIDNTDVDAAANFLWVISKSLNTDGAKKFYAVLEQAKADLAKIYDDPKNSGDLKIGTALNMTKF